MLYLEDYLESKYELKTMTHKNMPNKYGCSVKT